ncbi:MAG: hypothetical protein WHT08_16385 [Bryobacteraceae bacterium]|jgi:hypothetical protein
MQTVIQVISNRNESLRDRIVNDPRLVSYRLRVSTEKKKGRNRGWAKIHGSGDIQGALNVEWHASTRTLVGRIVNRGDGCPALLAAQFILYLLREYRDERIAIQIWPQEDTAVDGEDDGE